mgnify:CR=1 FL=1
MLTKPCSRAGPGARRPAGPELVAYRLKRQRHERHACPAGRFRADAIESMVGKWKVSQNQPAENITGIVEGLRSEGKDAMADLVDQRAAQGHALLHAARQLMGPRSGEAVEVRGVEELLHPSSSLPGAMLTPGDTPAGAWPVSGSTHS